MKKIEADLSKAELRALATEITARMMNAGDFKNSIRQWRIAQKLIAEAVDAHFALEDGFVGTGGFLLRDLADRQWASDLAVISDMDVTYQRSILKGSALHALNALRKRGAIEKHGITYKLGDLKNVLAELR